jgi:N-succinyl-L-ornithine transcarbamylase
MEEFKTDHRPKVVLSWAPHPKALTSSCRQFFCANDAIARRRFCHYTSEGYELNPEITKDPRLSTIRIKHLKMLILSTPKPAKDYGKITNNDTKWTVTADKMKLTNHAKFMHCLPVRRNVVVTDEVIDSANSLVIDHGSGARKRTKTPTTFLSVWRTTNIPPR